MATAIATALLSACAMAPGTIESVRERIRPSSSAVDGEHRDRRRDEVDGREQERRDADGDDWPDGASAPCSSPRKYSSSATGPATRDAEERERDGRTAVRRRRGTAADRSPAPGRRGRAAPAPRWRRTPPRTSRRRSAAVRRAGVGRIASSSRGSPYRAATSERRADQHRVAAEDHDAEADAVERLAGLRRRLAAPWRGSPSRPAAAGTGPRPAATGCAAIRLHGRDRGAPAARAGSRSAGRRVAGVRPRTRSTACRCARARAVDVALRVVADVQHRGAAGRSSSSPARSKMAGVGLRRAAPRPTSRRRRRAARAPIRSSASWRETSQFETTPIARPDATQAGHHVGDVRVRRRRRWRR